MVEPLVEKVIEHLVKRNETLSLAESCTGGLLSAWLAAQPGVSRIYQGSVVAYSNKVKSDVLGVPAHLLLSVGAVSTTVAIKMAQGARQVLDSDWAVSITGIAGPDGGTDKKPVGTVCLSVCGPGIEEVEQKYFEGDRSKIQNESARYALEMLLKFI